MSIHIGEMVKKSNDWNFLNKQKPFFKPFFFLNGRQSINISLKVMVNYM